MESSQKTHEGVMPHEIQVKDNVALRLLLPTDAPRLQEIFQADPEIQSRVTWTYGLSNLEDIEAAIKKFQESKSLRYAIQEEGRVIGYVGMWQDHGYMEGTAHDREYGFGYFMDPVSRGRSLTESATLSLMNEAERKFDIRMWAVYCEDDNSASQAVLEQLGFEKTDQTFEEPTMHTMERRWEKNIDEQTD